MEEGVAFFREVMQRRQRVMQYGLRVFQLRMRVMQSDAVVFMAVHEMETLYFTCSKSQSRTAVSRYP